MSSKSTIISRVRANISEATSSIYFLFPFFITLNLFTYTDRGIIPGASREFSTFAANANDSIAFIQRNPDAGIGILQAGFILGYSIAIIICGHLVHFIPWKRLTLTGFGLWILAVFGSALAHAMESYTMLFVARMLTGVSEASFQVIAPPMIQDRGGERSGLWLSLFLSAMPLGMSLGYVLGSQVANNHNLLWPWAFYIEGFIAIPVFLLGFLITDDKNGGVFAPTTSTTIATDSTDTQNQSGEGTENRNIRIQEDTSFIQEIKVCLSSKTLVAIIAAQSICIAIFAVLTTFGGAFLLALGLFESETQGASLFSITAALAGLVGTPMGGLVVDKILSKHKQNDLHDANNDTSNGGNESDEEKDKQIQNLRQLTSLLPVTTGIVATGIVVCYPTLLFNHPGPFLAFLFCGFIFLFAAQSGITMSIMLSVRGSHRSNALAFSTLMAHAFGDVPSPIIFGYIKDKLAPNCVVDSEGEFLDIDLCKSEHFGVRSTIGLAYAWITLSIVFFILARRMAKKELFMLEMGSDYYLHELEQKKEVELMEKREILENSLFPVKKPDNDDNDFDGLKDIKLEKEYEII